MDDLEYLAAAFIAVWVVLGGFILALIRKQRALEREMARIESEMGRERREP